MYPNFSSFFLKSQKPNQILSFKPLIRSPPSLPRGSRRRWLHELSRGGDQQALRPRGERAQRLGRVRLHSGDRHRTSRLGSRLGKQCLTNFREVQNDLSDGQVFVFWINLGIRQAFAKNVLTAICGFHISENERRKGSALSASNARDVLAGAGSAGAGA